MKNTVLFVLAVLGISLVKISLLTVSINSSHPDYVLAWDGGAKPYFYPSIPGTDTPMPFSTRTSTQSRTVGGSKLYYAVFSGSSVRDTRFKSVFR